MRALVTGGGGFVGLAICKALIERGDEAIAMDISISPELQRLSDQHLGLSVRPCDMTNGDDVTQIFEKDQPTVVIHCAAVVGVMMSLSNPANVFRINLEGTINLFEAMGRFDVKRMIHISSEENYGEFESDLITEDHPQYPLYSYGISKVAAEHLGRTYKLIHGLECINLRTSWVYGPDFPRKRVPCNLLEGAVSGEAVHVPFGAESKIDHTYIDDLVYGVIRALDCQNHLFDAYHIASGTCPSLNEIVKIIKELVPDADISVGDGIYKHDGKISIPRKGALDCTRARNAFGYVPQFDIKTGLTKYYEYLRVSQNQA